MQPRSILITGASSGIGAALATAYAAPGAMLHLSGRDQGRLAMVTDRCLALGANAAAARIDVSDSAAMEGWIRQADARRPLDLVIANAGISAGALGSKSGELESVLEVNATATRRIFATNIDGVVNTVLPALELMRARPARFNTRGRAEWRGQIAIVSSLAGMRGMPGAPAYSASKVAERAWGEALSIRLRREGIALSVVLPGFVDTPMTRRNPFFMPFLMTAEEAAQIIRRRLVRRAPRIAFPFPTYVGAWALSVLPTFLADPILALLPAKSES